MRVAAVVAVLALAAISLGQTPGFGVLVNQDGSFGLAVSGKPTLKEWDLADDAGSVSIEHSLDVVFGSKLESLPNHLYADVSGKIEWMDRPGENWVFDGALRGARIEATQDFRHVDFAAGGQVSLMNSHLFSFVFNALKKDTSEELTGASPSSITLGYARLLELANQNSLGPGWNSRLDGELFISIPVRGNFTLSFRGRTFNQPSNAFAFKTWKLMAEPVVTFRWGDKWLHLSYQRGALPPLYEPVSNWSVGAGFAFD